MAATTECTTSKNEAATASQMDATTTTTTTSKPPTTTTTILTGKIVRKKKFKQHLSLAIRDERDSNTAISTSIPLLIDRIRHRECLPWCCLGAWIRVEVEVQAEEEEEEEKVEGAAETEREDTKEVEPKQQQKHQHQEARTVELLQCAPDPNAVLLSLQLIAENKLSLDVLSSCVLQHLHQVTDILEAPREIQRREIGPLVRSLQHFGKGEEEDGSPKAGERITCQRIPHTKQRHLRVLERLEELIPLVDIYKQVVDGDLATTTTSQDTEGSSEERDKRLIPPTIMNLPDNNNSNAINSNYDANNKSDNDSSRVEYLKQKKWPQIQWMVQRLAVLGGGTAGAADTVTTAATAKARTTPTVINITEGRLRFQHVLDVGGGRGDLATAIATAFPELKHVTVVDSNQSSLEAGQLYAQQSLGMKDAGDRMTFHCADFADFVRDYDPTATATTQNSAPSIPPIDAVVALHACGDLSDLALQFAAQTLSAFVICPCCYTKRYIDRYQPSWIQRYKTTYCGDEDETGDGNADTYCQATTKTTTKTIAENGDNADQSANPKESSSRTHPSTTTNSSSTNANKSTPDDEVATVQRLAELNERPEISHRAMHVINSLRLQALVEETTSTSTGGNGNVNTRSVVRLEEYENTISMRNLVLVGELH